MQIKITQNELMIGQMVTVKRGGINFHNALIQGDEYRWLKDFCVLQVIIDGRVRFNCSFRHISKKNCELISTWFKANNWKSF